MDEGRAGGVPESTGRDDGRSDGHSGCCRLLGLAAGVSEESAARSPVTPKGA